MRKIKILTTILIAWALIISTACPTRTAIRRAEEASYQLAGSINDAQKALEQAYNVGVVNAATAQRMNIALAKANIGSKKLTATVIELRKITSDPNKIPQNKLDALNLILSDEIITPILQILSELHVISGNQSQTLFIAIQSIKTLILTISAIFPTKSSAMILIEQKELNYAE